MANDLNRAFSWGCGVTLGVVFVLVGLPVVGWLLCCGGLVSLGIVTTTTPSTHDDIPAASRKAGTTANEVAPDFSFADKDLNAVQSLAWLRTAESQVARGMSPRVYNGRRVGLTGTVGTVKQHPVASRGWYVILRFSPSLLCDVDVDQSVIARLRVGEVVTIRGVIADLITGSNDFTVRLENAELLPTPAELQQLEREKADAAAQAQREAAARRLADEQAAKNEAAAATTLRAAKADPDPASRVRTLRFIVANYPDTRAAAEAKKLLGP